MARKSVKRAAKKPAKKPVRSAWKASARKAASTRTGSTARKAPVKNARSTARKATGPTTGTRRSSGRATGAKTSARGSVRRLPQAKELKDLFHETLKDVYHAEKQLVRALPKMAKAAQSSELRDAFRNHLEETRGQVERIERVFKILGERVSAKPCHGMMGLVEEGQEAIEEFGSEPAADAGIIAAAQAVEHYEIARYGTLKTWASQLGMADAARLLDETLREEKKADELLNRIAEGTANRRARSS